ncbi:spore germination protein PD [Paenibacillus tianmuensis]|uniref:Spore germination protein PD n=1 Tax=Paenibacillus tianmuensis TaxID=624147 RepID=A0A1G4Q297_9BACL|nr:spore gernimation protein GerPD [Paenibacillus tianmuensis]SCW38565.1 spore germination protein PD [Paenibacillus tianmuensis]
MNLQVENRQICVGNIQVVGVASSSVFLIGDTEVISLSSVFDTPPESLIIGPLVPLASGRA